MTTSAPTTFYPHLWAQLSLDRNDHNDRDDQNDRGHQSQEPVAYSEPRTGRRVVEDSQSEEDDAYHTEKRQLEVSPSEDDDASHTVQWETEDSQGSSDDDTIHVGVVRIKHQQRRDSSRKEQEPNTRDDTHAVARMPPKAKISSKKTKMSSRAKPSSNKKVQFGRRHNMSSEPEMPSNPIASKAKKTSPAVRHDSASAAGSSSTPTYSNQMTNNTVLDTRHDASSAASPSSTPKPSNGKNKDSAPRDGTPSAASSSSTPRLSFNTFSNGRQFETYTGHTTVVLTLPSTRSHCGLRTHLRVATWEDEAEDLGSDDSSPAAQPVQAGSSNHHNADEAKKWTPGQPIHFPSHYTPQRVQEFKDLYRAAQEQVKNGERHGLGAVAEMVYKVAEEGRKEREECVRREVAKRGGTWMP